MTGEAPRSWPNLGTDLLSAQNLALLRTQDRFVVLAGGLVVVAALGGATAVGSEVLATVLVGVSMVIVFFLVALVEWRAVSMRRYEADLVSQSSAAQAVNGEWWQLVYAKDHPGLTYLCVAIAEVAEQHAIHGITFDEHGKRIARWSSDAVAVKTSTPVELYYLWRGSILQGGSDGQIISGLGRLRFDSVGREVRPMEGEATFTRGTPGEMEFDEARTGEIVRLSEEERRQSRDDPSSLSRLAAEAFRRFDLEPGRILREGPSLTGPAEHASTAEPS